MLRALWCIRQQQQVAAVAAAAVSSSVWNIQKRFMGGARKSMARHRMLMIKKHKRELLDNELSKRPRNPVLDAACKQHSACRLVWNVKKVLAAAEGRVMASAHILRLGKFLGFPRGVPFGLFISKYPAIFRYTRDKQDGRILWLEFTEAAEDLIDEEERYMREVHEAYLVEVIRKFLMMARHHRIPLAKFSHLKPTVMLPDDWQERLIPKYPQFFRIEGSDLVLQSFDHSLAVTAREKTTRSRYSFFVERDLRMGKVVRTRLAAFQALPFPSPYESCEELDPKSLEAQKRVVAVCHEFLSLSVGKEVRMGQLTSFKTEFRLCHRLEDILVRYPHIFYVSQKGGYTSKYQNKGNSHRHTVILKEAYCGSSLKDRHPLVRMKTRFLKLMNIQPTRTTREILESLPGLKSELTTGDATFPYHEAELPRLFMSRGEMDPDENDKLDPVPEPVVVDCGDMSFPHKLGEGHQHPSSVQADSSWSFPYKPDSSRGNERKLDRGSYSGENDRGSFPGNSGENERKLDRGSYSGENDRGSFPDNSGEKQDRGSFPDNSGENERKLDRGSFPDYSGENERKLDRGSFSDNSGENERKPENGSSPLGLQGDSRRSSPYKGHKQRDAASEVSDAQRKRAAERERLWSKVEEHKKYFSYARYKGDDEEDEDDGFETAGSFQNLAKKLGIDNDEENMDVFELESAPDSKPIPKPSKKHQESDEEEFVQPKKKRFKNAWKNKLYNDKLLELSKARKAEQDKKYIRGW